MAGNRFFCLVFIFALGSCSLAGLKERQGARSFLNEGKYDLALKTLEDSKEYKDTKNTLLLFLEKGLIFHAAGSLEESTKALDEAKKIAKELFTVSLSKKAEKIFVSEASDNYYGEAYEHSMIYFYLALNHYMMSQKASSEEIRRRELFSARAEVLDWDSFLKTIQKERLGQSVFKNDLLMKVFGALIHESMMTRSDDQIALLLYKEAQDVLLKNYNAYPTFNSLFGDFKKDFDKLPKLPIDKVLSTYVSETSSQKNLKEFLKKKILSLSKKDKNPKSNVAFVLEKGLIPLKVGDRFYFGLNRGGESSEGAKAFSDFSAALLTLFAAEKLGLMPPPNSWNPGGVYLGLNVASFAVNGLAISFELPKIEAHQESGEVRLSVYNEKNEMILENHLTLINPLADIASEAIAENSTWLYSRVGLRLAGKHLVAIAAAYATYRALGGGDGDFFARQAAVIQYVATSKIIEQTERADTRYWSTLPQDIFMSDFFLPKGKYRLKLEVLNGSEIQETYDLGNFEIIDTEKKTFINFRTKGVL